jgi:hypothetical protein
MMVDPRLAVIAATLDDILATPNLPRGEHLRARSPGPPCVPPAGQPTPSQQSACPVALPYAKPLVGEEG